VRTGAEYTLLAAKAMHERVAVLHGLGNIVPKAPGVRSVVTVHDLIFLRYPETTSRLLARGAGAIVPFSARRADAVIAISQATSDDVVGLAGVPPSRVHVVHSGPGARCDVSGTSEAELRARFGLGDGPVILSVSARRPHKNLSQLIIAMAEVPDAMLVLPGYPTPYDEELRELARQRGVAKRVVFCDWVTSEDLEGLYAVAVCMAFPTLGDGTRNPRCRIGHSNHA
jgi:glycosyltransferase involved in cell wall biosynthesis